MTIRPVMAHPTVAVFEYHLTEYRRVWRGSVFSSFVMPLLFFFGIGLGVGAFVDRGGGLDLPYVQFLAAGLMAFTGAQVGMIEAGFPVLGRFKWYRTYYAMANAPLRVGDMVAGQLGYIALRILVAAGAFLLVMLPFGAVGSVWALTTPLLAVLVGLAIAAPMFGYSATVNSPNTMAIMFRFGMLPMMLFSGVFFPLDQLPVLLRPLAYALPLWHGVELSRSATVGTATAWPPLVHVGYLVVWLAVGFPLAVARFRKRLGE